MVRLYAMNECNMHIICHLSQQKKGEICLLIFSLHEYVTRMMILYCVYTNIYKVDGAGCSMRFILEWNIRACVYMYVGLFVMHMNLKQLANS